MQIEKSLSEGKRIMPETRFTEFPAVSVGPGVGVSHSVWETFFLTSEIENYYLSFVISFIFDLLHRIATVSECHF